MASAGGSRSSGNQEGDGESAINPVVSPRAENMEPEVVVTDDPDSQTRRPSKRKKVHGSKPPRPENRPADVDVEDMEEDEAVDPDSQIGRDVEAGPDRMGNHTAADLAKIMAGIPAKSDWFEMRRSGLNAVVEKCAEHWGQVTLFFT